MKVVIMAGGKGSRIASVKSDVPKPMIEICGKPILQYQIENLRQCGLRNITLVIGHLGHVIQEFFGDGNRFGVNITYFVEEHPLGTAGALFQMPELTEDFLLLCGDVMLDVDFNRFIQFHQEHDAWASLMVHPNGHPFDSSLLVTEILPPQESGGMPVETQRVLQWMNKEDERTYYRNCVNAGIEIISPKLLKIVYETLCNDYETLCNDYDTLALRKRYADATKAAENDDENTCITKAETMVVERNVVQRPEAKRIVKIDLDRDVLKPNIKTGKIFAYHTPEYIKDMGTPERFYETEKDILNGKPAARNLKNKQKAIFLDRDGTVNIKKGFLTKAEDMELIDGAAEAIRLINLSEYLAIVVTNQPQIARGDCSFEELQLIHDKMETDLGKHGAFVDAIYYCPHHTDKGFPGERIEYKCNCDCRKPKPGLLMQAAQDFNIDLSQSYMIGDNDNDVKAGEAAGCQQVCLIETNQKDALLNMVKQILNG